LFALQCVRRAAISQIVLPWILPPRYKRVYGTTIPPSSRDSSEKLSGRIHLPNSHVPHGSLTGTGVNVTGDPTPHKPGSEYYTDNEDWVTFCCSYDPTGVKEVGTATGLQPGTDYMFRVRAHLKLVADVDTTHSPFGRWGPYSRPVVVATDSPFGVPNAYASHDADLNIMLAPKEHDRQVVQHPEDPYFSTQKHGNAHNIASYSGHG
jgi:hypothetical protein